MYNSNNIAERIKALAKKRGISLAALLLDADLGRNTMAHFKTSMPKADTLARIADCLDCSVDYLLGRTDVPEVNRGEPTHLIKMAARAGGGIREVALTESQIEALKNLPEVPNLDDKKDKK